MEIEIRDRAALAQIFVKCVEEHARRAGGFSLALPGGSVAEAFCPALAAAGVDWKRADLFWCDERAVPSDHQDSNFRVANELLLRRVDVPAERIHRMPADAADLDAAAASYEREILGIPGGHGFDIVLLGVGPDGHVCSLFPGHPALEEASRLVLAIEDSPKPPPRRLTLTLPALRNAFLVAAAFGESKSAAIASALQDRESRLPLALALRGAGRALLLLDPDAARGLTRSES